MSKKKTALDRVRNNPKNATAKDLLYVLEDNGFKHRNTSGDHFIYKRKGFRPISIPRNQNPISIRIVKEVLQAIDMIEEQSGN